MAAPVVLSTSDQLRHLEDARKLVLSDSNYYAAIVPGILPITSASSAVELRRWGAEFIAEVVSAPAVPTATRMELCLKILETLKRLVEEPDLDIFILKSVIMASASVYPLILRWIATNPYDKDNWEMMASIKSSILRIWEGAPPPVKICCVKFAQRVVLAQTASNGAEQKHSGLDVSISVIPPNHPILDPRYLEAEATGLLDRMLGILQDNSSDAVLVDATLNTLSVLIRTRPSTSNRTLNAVLNFNPLKLANSPMTPKIKVLVKSMEKTTRMLLIHLVKRDPHNPMSGRIQQHVERLMRSRSEIFDEANRKRALADPAAAAAGGAKRQKVEAMAIPQLDIKPLSPGTHTLAQVFTITRNTALQGFDACQIPPTLAARISTTALASIHPELLNQAVTGIRDRLTALSAVAQPALLNPDTAPLDVEEDDDDYEPDYYAAEDTEQILNKLDSAPAEQPPNDELDTASALAPLGTFKLPPPPSLDPDSAARAGQVAVSRVFTPLSTLGDPPARKSKAGINRLAASSYDRDSWLTVIMRLATRSTMGLEATGGGSTPTKAEEAEMALDRPRPVLGDGIREMLYTYVLEDFRRRIDVAVSWLCEEWYSDQLARRSFGDDAPQHYEKWALRLVDGFLPYLTPQDKVLTRFLGEIPELSRELLGRIKSLCRDPSTVPLVLTSLLYLVMMRPPAREVALDIVAAIWVEFEDARPLAAKYLVKWRPGFIESQTSGHAAGMSGAGGPSNVAVAT